MSETLLRLELKKRKSCSEKKYQKWRHQFELKPLVNLELEEFKQNHLAEIDEIKRKGDQDIEALQTENEKLLAQVVEVEQALDKLKNQQKDCIDGVLGISYNGLFIKNT